MEYYNKNGIKVRTSKKSDAEYLQDKLRKSDIDEIWASHHHTPATALKLSLEQSIYCCTVENGHPIAVFGICPDTILGDKASVWLLATDDLTKITFKFLKESKRFINIMLSYYRSLYNYVDCRNTASIEWLKFCGAKFEEPKQFGVENKMFMKFSFERK